MIELEICHEIFLPNYRNTIFIDRLESKFKMIYIKIFHYFSVSSVFKHLKNQGIAHTLTYSL
jgi:hypothetical protein